MDRRVMPSVQWVSLLCVLLFAVSGCNALQSSAWLKPGGQSDVLTSAGQAVSTRQLLGNTNFPAGRPVDFAAFKNRYQTVGASPAGAVRMYFDAVYSYIDPARRSEGAKMLRYSIHEKQGWENFSSQQTFVSRLRNSSYHYIFRSFAEGTSPENSYAMNPDNYRLIFTGARQETDFVAVSIRSSGADHPRSLQVQKFEDGLWYVTGYSSSYVEVRQPADQRRSGGHDADLD